MKVSRDDLLTALDAVCPIAGKRTTLPTLNCVQFSIVDQMLCVRATDLEQDESVMIPCTGKIESFCVSAKKIHDLTRFAKDEIELTVNKDNIVFESNGTVKLAKFAVDEFPPAPKGEFTALGLSTSDFADGIDAVQWAMKDDKNCQEQFKMAVHVEADAQNIVCAATTGFVIAYFKRASVTPKCSFDVLQDFVDRFSKLLRKEGATVFVSENHLHIKHDTGSYFCKRGELTFPFKPLTQMTEADKKELGELELAPLAIAAQTCLLLSPDPWAHTKITLNNSGIEVKFEHRTGDSYRTLIRGDYPGETLSINMETFLKCLRAFKCEKVKMAIAKEDFMPPVFLMNGELTVLTSQVRNSE